MGPRVSSNCCMKVTVALSGDFTSSTCPQSRQRPMCLVLQHSINLATFSGPCSTPEFVSKCVSVSDLRFVPPCLFVFPVLWLLPPVSVCLSVLSVCVISVSVFSSSMASYIISVSLSASGSESPPKYSFSCVLLLLLLLLCYSQRSSSAKKV